MDHPCDSVTLNRDHFPWLELGPQQTNIYIYIYIFAWLVENKVGTPKKPPPKKEAKRGTQSKKKEAKSGTDSGEVFNGCPLSPVRSVESDRGLRSRKPPQDVRRSKMDCFLEVALTCWVFSFWLS